MSREEDRFESLARDHLHSRIREEDAGAGRTFIAWAFSSPLEQVYLKIYYSALVASDVQIGWANYRRRGLFRERMVLLSEHNETIDRSDAPDLTAYIDEVLHLPPSQPSKKPEYGFDDGPTTLFVTHNGQEHTHELGTLADSDPLYESAQCLSEAMFKRLTSLPIDRLGYMESIRELRSRLDITDVPESREFRRIASAVSTETWAQFYLDNVARLNDGLMNSVLDAMLTAFGIGDTAPSESLLREALHRSQSETGTYGVLHRYLEEYRGEPEQRRILTLIEDTVDLDHLRRTHLQDESS